MEKFTKMDTLPQFEMMRAGGDGMPLPAINETLPRWSGKAAFKMPPRVGERINVTMNCLGPAVVLGYFTEGGFLGLRVKLESPPAWWTKQNADRIAKGEIESAVFGIEIAPL